MGPGSFNFYISSAETVLLRHSFKPAVGRCKKLVIIMYSTQEIGPSVAVQAVSRSDDGTTIIIDFFSFWSECRCAGG